MNLRVLSLLLLTCAFICQADAQYRFISFSVSDGLSQNSVTCIYQDTDGLLWLGTQDGLNSFDGHNFHSYKYDAIDSSSLSDQFVLSITGDQLGYLWIATRSGYNRFNKRTGKFDRFHSSKLEKEGLGYSRALLYHNAAGDILADYGEKPFVITPGTANPHLLPLPGDNFYVTYDATGDTWGFDKQWNLVHRFQKKQYQDAEFFVAPIELRTNRQVMRITPAANGMLWCYPVSGTGKIFFFDTHLKKWLPTPIALPHVINQILVARNGDAWAATAKGIYIIRNGQIIQHLSDSEKQNGAILSGNILSIFQDAQDNIWIGSANAGFAYYHPAFDHFTLLHTQAGDEAVTGYVSFPDEKWIGSGNGVTVLRFDKTGHLVSKTSPDFFKGKKIVAMTSGSDNKIWIAIHKQGLFVLNREGDIVQRFTGSDSSLQTKNILQLYRDSRNRVWVCTEKGFFVYDPNAATWHNFYQDEKSAPATGWYVLNAFEDAEHQIWIAKHGGVDVYNAALGFLFSIKSKTNKDPIGRTIVTGCTQDSLGAIWIASLSNGVYRYYAKKLQHYTTADGLNSNIIYGITTDNRGQVWITTTAGIGVFDNKTNRFHAFNSSDGLPVADYALGSLQNPGDGTLLAGSSDGLLTIYANALAIEKKTVYAYVSSIFVDELAVTGDRQSLVLAHGYKTISFDFALQQAIQPRKIIYQFRMKGADATWTTLAAGSYRIGYSQLPFRHLALQVRAAYFETDLALAPVYEVLIDVRPAFWQTTWFRVLMIVVALAGIVGLIQLYNRKRFKMQAEEIMLRKKLQEERERIGRDLHDNIGAYTAALIAGLQQLKSSHSESNAQMDELSAHASNIMGYLRETIWVLNHQSVSLTAFCDRFDEYAKRITRYYPQIKLDLHENIETDRSLSPAVSLHVFRILQEALQNACKHAGASVINIQFHSAAMMQFSVSDNGSGWIEAVKPDTYGLQSMQLRAAEAGFRFEIVSKNLEGTQVTLTELN